MNKMLIMGVAFPLLVTLPGFCAEEDEVETVSKTVEGIHFQVPSDLPIEKKEGALKPLPYDVYLHRKIEAIGSRLEKMEKKVNLLGKRLSVIERSSERRGP